MIEEIANVTQENKAAQYGAQTHHHSYTSIILVTLPTKLTEELFFTSDQFQALDATFQAINF